MLDWRDIDWWDLPGPSRFIERAASAVFVGDQGVLGLLLPSPCPDGLLDALSRRISERFGAQPVRVDASAGLRGRSPVHLLAAIAGVAPSTIRSVAAFVDAPELSNSVFLVEGLPPDEWITWGLFFRGQRSERARRTRAMSPTICVVVPSGTSTEDIRGALGGHDICWLGVVSRLDSQIYAERATGFGGDDLVSRTAVSTIIEVAAWDPSVIRVLAQLPVEVQLDPRDRLVSLPIMTKNIQPCWANRLVDHWDGQVLVHLDALLAAGDVAAIARRVWRGHVRTIFPFVEQVRHTYAVRYEHELRARLPIEKIYGGAVRRYTEPHTLELYDLFQLLKDALPTPEWDLLFDCYKLRRLVAHMEPGESSRICRVSRLWDELSDKFHSTTSEP